MGTKSIIFSAKSTDLNCASPGRGRRCNRGAAAGVVVVEGNGSFPSHTIFM